MGAFQQSKLFIKLREVSAGRSRRLGVFRLIGIDEQIERLLRAHFVLGLANIVRCGFGLWLRQLWQAIEHAHRFVLQAPLLVGFRIHFVERGPEPHGTVPDGQFGSIYATAREVEQNLTPALLRPLL